MAKKKSSAPGKKKNDGVQTGKSSPKKGRRSGSGIDLALVGPAALLLLTPVVFLPGLTDNFRPPKLFLAELLGLLSLVLLSLRLWFRRTVDLRPVFRSPALWAVLALVPMAALSGWLGEHRAHFWRSFPSLVIGILCWLGWTLALTDEERRRLLRLTIWPATLLSLLAILQFHEIFDPFTFERRLTQRLSLTSLAGGAFDLAGYLMLPLLVAMAWLRSAEGRARILLASASAICAYGLLLTQTLTVVIAVVLAVALYWAPEIPRRRLLAGSLLLVIGGSLLVMASPMRQRVVNKLQDLQRGEINRLLTGRLDGWRAAGFMIGEQPLNGVGHGGFRAEFGLARMELIEGGAQFFKGQHQVFFVNAHNDWLEATAEWGLAGGAVLFVAIWLLWRSRKARGPGEGHTVELRRLEPAACAGVALLASTNFPFHVALIAYPWLLFLSGLPGLRGQPAAEGDGAEPLPESSLRGLPGKGLAVVSVVVLSLILMARFESAKNLLGADRLVALAERRSRMMVASGGRIPAKALQENIAMMKRAQELDPASVTAHLVLGGNYMLMKRYSAAIRSLERAIELEPRAEPFANLARCYLALDQNDKAMEAITKAIQLDHNQRKHFLSIIQKHRRHEQWQEQKGEGS